MEDIDAIALLQDPVRRRLYEFVAAQGREVGRGEAAEAAGVARTLAAFHLDKLVDAGLLEAGSRRLTGRSGPGAGRPAKVYRRSAAERDVSLPARDYRTAAGLLAEAAETAGLDMELQDAARRRGRAMRGPGAPIGGLEELADVLAGRGYEPVADEGGAVLRMRNCPFHAVAEQFPPLVCGMNLALLEGLVEGSRVRVRMDPRPGWCCVAAAAASKDNEH
ncbi:putative ArsR family transcriptional regulator [Actinomadura coerulea]|uniref:Putative ArsR family transcriptional regulator n=1 Tax=Actinomadura coerulea TaxID=46159 RepID=A0A7X0KY86_9ACTN|nr:helix-turn-helix domain-containing protein [Actinomadura coerulea]MBB6395145.1 putative ArsR family transcriptional regulator [Actinomadura coerulea]GGQ15101.1 ArsR family transcriptional regulator [Actinomadura coerulea]